MDSDRQKGPANKHGPTGWGSSATKNKQSVAILTDILAGDQGNRFYTNFADSDTNPDFDGYLLVGKPEIAQDRIQPFAQFEVQIKALPPNYCNANKRRNRSQYKYKCQTNVIATVAAIVTENPVLLLLVDCNRKIAFCKYLDLSYCIDKIEKGDQDYHTIYFDDSEQIEPLDNFYERLVSIKAEFRTITDDIVADDSIPHDLYREISNSCQEMNSTLDNDLRFVKKTVFPNAGRFGIACNLKNKILTTKIFSINKGENGEWVREFDLQIPPNTKLSSSWLFDPNDLVIQSGFAEKYAPQERIDSFLKDTVKKFCSRCFLPSQALDNSVLEEAAFYFLDTLACRLDYRKCLEEGASAFEKDALTVEELAYIWEAIKDAVIYESGKERSGGKASLITVLGDPLSKRGSQQVANKWHDLFIDALKNPLKNCELNVGLQGKFPYQYIDSVIAELQARNIHEVKRLWAKRNVRKAKVEHEACKDWPQIDRGYSRDEYYAELARLIIMLEKAYATASSFLFEDESDRYVEKGRLTFFLDPESYKPELAYSCTDESKPLQTEYELGKLPDAKMLTGYKYFTETNSRFNFSKLPLYTVLEFFVTRKLKNEYKLNSGARFGELKKEKTTL